MCIRDRSIAIMGQKLGQAELARADIIIRPKVLDMGSADFGPVSYTHLDVYKRQNHQTTK